MRPYLISLLHCCTCRLQPRLHLPLACRRPCFQLVCVHVGAVPLPRRRRDPARQGARQNKVPAGAGTRRSVQCQARHSWGWQGGWRRWHRMIPGCTGADRRRGCTHVQRGVRGEGDAVQASGWKQQRRLRAGPRAQHCGQAGRVLEGHLLADVCHWRWARCLRLRASCKQADTTATCFLNILASGVQHLTTLPEVQKQHQPPHVCNCAPAHLPACRSEQYNKSIWNSRLLQAGAGR